jgi:hypothetical protein
MEWPSSGARVLDGTREPGKGSSRLVLFGSVEGNAGAISALLNASRHHGRKASDFSQVRSFWLGRSDEGSDASDGQIRRKRG